METAAPTLSPDAPPTAPTAIPLFPEDAPVAPAAQPSPDASAPANGTGSAAKAAANGVPVCTTEPRLVQKPWGHELIWAETDLYVGKILHVRAKHALSLQLHRRKDETMHVLRGRVAIEIGRLGGRLRTHVLGPGKGIRLPPGTVHRVTAAVDSDVLEVSTPHLDDLIRLEDRYGRCRSRP